MQPQAISELQFSKFSGGACHQTPPSRLKKIFSAAIKIFFRFNKTRPNFGLDPRLLPLLFDRSSTVRFRHKTFWKRETGSMFSLRKTLERCV